MPGFLQIVDAARKAVLANTEQGKDPFSSANLFSLLNNKIAPLDALIHFIADRVLKYDKDQKILSRKVVTSGKSTVDDSIDHLTGKVLFLDEVLPPPTSSNESSEDAPARLRFVRNLGRALRMRVVMAGTAANMITFRSKGANAAAAASREGEAERGWMEIQFLWIPLTLPTLLGPAVDTEHKERPYLRSMLELMPQTPPETQVDILNKVAIKIASDKKISNKGKLIWLSGCWLASESDIPPSPFPMGPADLVKNHFFEPALAVFIKIRSSDGKIKTRRTRISGNLRIVLQRRQDDKHIWWVLVPRGMKAGLSSDFTRIESALSNCVQSCLAMEPVLAASISIRHNFSPDEFRLAFSELWKESPQQRTSGRMDGELNEFLMFAALQMACRAGDGDIFPRTRSAADMVERLWQYLSAKSASPSTVVIAELGDLLGCAVEDYANFYNQEKLDYSYGFEGKDDENCISNLHKTTMMPWLVPACSYARLKKTILQSQGGEQSLFSGMGIAGLVPGIGNSNLDASAYLWIGHLNLKVGQKTTRLMKQATLWSENARVSQTHTR